MKTKYTGLQIVLEVLSALAVVASLLLVALAWSGLPEQLPLHFDFTGEADDWGGRGTALICPIAGLVLYGGLSAIIAAPGLWNMAVEPREENREQLYANTKTMLLWLKLEVGLIFFYITYGIIRLQGLLPWFLPVSLVAVFGTLGWYLYRQVAIDKRTRRLIRIDSEVIRLKRSFPVSFWWLAVPILLAAVLLVYALARGGGLFWALLPAWEVLVFCLMRAAAARAKSKVYSENPNVNMALNRLRIRQWTKFWVFAAYNAALCGIACYAVLAADSFAFGPAPAAIYLLHAALAVAVCVGMQRGLAAEIARLAPGEGHAQDG